MIKRFHQVALILEILLFILSVGALSYLAQNALWTLFIIILVICIIVFAILQVARTRPVLARLDLLEEKEFRLAKRTEQSGILDIYNIQDPSQQHERNEATSQIILRGDVFSLLSLTAASYIDPGIKRHWDILKLKLDGGAPFRLLLMNPFCKEKEVRDRLNSIATPYDTKSRLDLVIDLYNRYPNFNVRFTSYSIYCAVFFSEDEMIYDPYHLGKVGDRIENYFIAFRIKRMRDDRGDIPSSYFNILKQHFEFLWSTSEDLEQFIKKYDAQLSGTPFKGIPIVSRYNVKGN
jgi:hypothetical protein